MHILDNECSEGFKAEVYKNNMTFQLVPLHNHQQNIAKKAIQTFKVWNRQEIPPSLMVLPSPTSRAYPQHAAERTSHT